MRICPVSTSGWPGTFFVHRARRDLLRLLGVLAALLGAGLDVLVLPFPLRAGSSGHVSHLPSPAPGCAVAAASTHVTPVHSASLRPGPVIEKRNLASRRRWRFIRAREGRETGHAGSR